MKERMRLLGVFLLVLALTSCRESVKPVIGFVPRGSTQVFWQTVHAGAVKASREFDVELDWNAPGAQVDAARQSAIIDSMVKRRVAGIVLAPADSKLIVPAVERAMHAGIPVAIIDSDVATSQRLTLIAIDGRATGATAARQLGELMRREGKAALLGSAQDGSASAEVEAGFAETLKSIYPKIQLVRTMHVENKGQAIAATEEILRANPDLSGLLTGSLASSEGAVYTLRSQAKSQVRIVAFDSSPELVDQLRNRFIDVLIVRDPMKLGYMATEAVVKKIRGGSPEGRMSCDVQLVDRTNLESPDMVTLLYPDVKSYLGPEAN